MRSGPGCPCIGIASNDSITVYQPHLARKLSSAINLKVQSFPALNFLMFSVIYMFITQHIETDFFYRVQDISHISRIKTKCSTNRIITVKVYNKLIYNHHKFLFLTWNVSYQLLCLCVLQKRTFFVTKYCSVVKVLTIFIGRIRVNVNYVLKLVVQV
jgi:hypothetical protein